MFWFIQCIKHTSAHCTHSTRTPRYAPVVMMHIMAGLLYTELLYMYTGYTTVESFGLCIVLGLNGA